MQAELGIVRLDLLFEAISGIIALMITYYATKAYRLTGQKKLSDLSTGFLVLSAGMFGRVVGTIYFITQSGEVGSNLIISIVTIAYGMSRIMAYILFVISTRPAKTHFEQEFQNNTGVSMLLMATFLVDTSLEVIAILVLVVVVLQAVLNYMSTRSKFARYVLVGFFLLLLSHILMAGAETSPGLYLLSQGTQLLGFLSMLVMLIQAGRD
jgi:thiol:disulfide interchange protein